MAVFTDLHTETGLKSLEEYLSGKIYISGDQLTKDDIKVYAAVLEKPDAALANASRWYDTVSSSLAERFPGKAAGVRICAQATPADAAPAAAAEAAPAGDDDDDLDLFGEETEEDKKVEEARTAAYKASMKTKESGKSSVLLDVKPWDDETDMKKLEETVRSIEIPGLLWGACMFTFLLFSDSSYMLIRHFIDRC
ncbi:hypothetical protein AQUCO_00100688v1 [Aquilegia coerulea]|uniref:Translation elongation factor EF1B beta/delta subunit guanine nucleotide exchange domain-containing protein n=1 Tax=Aquilegia coerulea TaxID=218851 RepID=A0A2G5FBS0_AQUCA|nr:hypothetical protein AQUCO_00100688v1 [Aquilegia coerulea]